MKISDHYCGSYFVAKEFEGPLTLTIRFVRTVKFDNESKFAVDFEGENRTLVLNKTVALALTDFFGDETDKWIGQEVELFRDTTLFNGKVVPCIRVREARPRPEQKPAPQPSKPRQAPIQAPTTDFPVDP